MKTTFISKENDVVKFSMDFTAEEFEAAVIRAYQQNKGQFLIPGFRKGKAPRSIIEKHYGEGIFFDDAINDLINKNYSNSIDELKLEVIDSPKADPGEVAKGAPLAVTIEVQVYPEVEVKDYLGLEVQQTKTEITDEDIDTRIKAEQKKLARMVSVDRPAAMGDTLILDYSGFVGNEQFEGGTAENQQLVLGSNTFIPGFEEQLEGVSAGENADVKVTFPEQYHAPELAGKEAVFHCTVHEVKEEELPEIDDELAKDANYDSLEDMKKEIRERLEETAFNRAKDEARYHLIEALWEKNKISVPKAMVDREIENMISEQDMRWRQQGISFEQIMQYSGMTREQVVAEFRPEAEKRAAGDILLRAVAKAENIDAGDEDLEKYYVEMAKLYSNDTKTFTVDDIKEMTGEEYREYILRDMRTNKALDLLYDKAVITFVDPVAPVEAAEEAPAEAEEAAEAPEEKTDEE